MHYSGRTWSGTLAKLLSGALLLFLVAGGFSGVLAFKSIEELAALEPLPEEIVTALEAKVDEILRTYNPPQTRRNHGTFIELGDALVRKGEFERAHEMYVTGLQWNPLHLEAQLKAAELEIMFGMTDRARRRLDAVLLRSEDVHQLTYVLNLLAKYPADEPEDTPESGGCGPNTGVNRLRWVPCLFGPVCLPAAPAAHSACRPLCLTITRWLQKGICHVLQNLMA